VEAILFAMAGAKARSASSRYSMIRKSGYRFSEKIMLKQKIERDDDSKKSHPALVVPAIHAFPARSRESE